MEESFLHYTSVGKKEKLLSLSSRCTCETILNVARIRKNEKVIALAACINETENPQIRFHKTCRFMFTMKKKKKLEKLQKENNEPKEKFNAAGVVVRHQVLVVSVVN